MRSAIIQRLKNICFTSLVFWPIMFTLAYFGVLPYPLSQYAFWYILGALIGFPLWLTYDWWKMNKDV